MAHSPTTLPSNNPSVLVTGATGLIGRWLLARLCREGRSVGALVRGGEARRTELARFVSEHGGDPRHLTLIDGDLGVEEPFAAAGTRLDDVRDVYHLAAAFKFGMEPSYARHVNVGGTLRVAAFAKTLPRLRRFIALGGYRATRLPDWLPDAGPLPSVLRDKLYKEHGAYEASKLEAHLALGEFAREHALPLTSVHPSTVIGSSLTGETSQRTGLAETVERLWSGQMPALVGTARTFVPIVCVDYLADFLASVPGNPATLGQDLCVLDSKTPNLPVLVSHMAAHLGVRAPRRIISKGLVAALPEAMTGVEKETLTFLSEDRYDTRAAEEHAEHAKLSMPEWEPAVERWLDFLVSTRFLQAEEEESTQGHFVSCAGSQTYVEGDIEEADTLFLHGLPWNGESGRGLADAMNENILRPDLPGMGRSSSCEGSFDEWLDALLASRTRPIRIVAHSLSTGIALRFAKRWPERVRELVLVSPFFLQAPAPRWLRCPILTSRLLRVGDAKAMSRRLLGGRLLGEGVSSQAVVSAHAHIRRRGVSWNIAKALSRASRSEERAFLLGALRRSETPCCLIHGTNDAIELDDDATTFSIEGAGHNPHVQKPEVVARVIQEWRSAQTAGKDPDQHERVTNPTVVIDPIRA